MVKKAVFIFLVLFLVSLVYASGQISLDIKKEPIKDVLISEVTDPARFLFTINNLGDADNFEIYTLIGIDMTPKGMFSLSKGETKTFEVDAYLSSTARKSIGNYVFTYKIRGENSGILDDSMQVRLVRFEDLFSISADDLEFDSNMATINLQNNENLAVDGLSLKVHSTFFDYSQENISIKANEKLIFQIPVNSEKKKELVAGKYLLESTINYRNLSKVFENSIKYLEKKDVEETGFFAGLFIRDTVVEKENKGNVASIEKIEIKKNIISRLFTTFNTAPDKLPQRKGLSIYYTWQRELKPGETLRIRVRTNWTWPFVIVLAIILIALAINLYLKRDVSISKKVVYVKTKTGEFALKVVISIKARKYVENVKIIDKLPMLVKIHEKYKTLEPDVIDEKNRRLEWNLGGLNAGENRVFSYIIYSKVNVLGRFSIPEARVIYEREGRVEGADSNKVFFLTETRKQED